MALKLYINESPIELADRSKIGLTFQINNLNDLQTRQGYYSNEFSAPRTRSNDRLLGFSSDINSSTIIPYRNNIAKVVQDGIEVIPDGIAIVQAFDGFYKIIVYSGNVDIFDAIGDGIIADLDWEYLNHLWNYTNILATDGAIKDYTYPLVDYGDLTNSIPFGLSVYSAYLYPALFCKTILDKILAATGYSASGTMYNSSQLANLLLSVTTWNKTKEYIEAHTCYSMVNPNSPLVTLSFPPGNTTQVMNFIATFNSNTEMILGAFIYTPTFNGWGTLALVGSIQFDTTALPVTTYLVDIIDVTTATVIATTTAESVTGTVQKNFYLANYGYYTAGHQYQARLAVSASVAATLTVKYIVLAGTSYSFEPQQVLGVGELVEINSVIPTIKSKDFIKAICNMTSAVFSTNIVTRKITFNFLDDILANLPKAKNWSDKIDVRGVNLQYHNNNYGQSNNFKYKEDDSVTQYYEDSVITIDDETLDLTKNLVQLPFAATENYVNLESYYVPRIKFKTNSTTYKKIEPRVLMLDNTASSAVRLYDSLNTANNSLYTEAPYAYFVHPARDESIGFNSNLISNYYKTITSIFTKYKEITINFNLTAVDISELDFLIPIYLDVHVNDIRLNGYFYLNKVDNYKGGELTKCKLIRI